MRFFIDLSYRGTAYHGWQRQPNGISVQQEIEEALTTVLRVPTPILGAGRTDAGVHAKQMIAHFDADLQMPIEQLIIRLNGLLPPDIAIHSIRPVHNDAHARFDATSRRYEYWVSLQKNPFQQHQITELHCHPDFELMNRAASRLMNYTDFTSFSKLHTDVKTNNCTVTQAHWDEREPGVWCFTIEANRFLRNMVRAIVGTLLDVGRGKLTVEQFCQIIELKDRCQARSSAPADGLYLVEVKYPY